MLSLLLVLDTYSVSSKRLRMSFGIDDGPGSALRRGCGRRVGV